MGSPFFPLLSHALSCCFGLSFIASRFLGMLQLLLSFSAPNLGRVYFVYLVHSWPVLFLLPYLLVRFVSHLLPLCPTDNTWHARGTMPSHVEPKTCKKSKARHAMLQSFFFQNGRIPSRCGCVDVGGGSSSVRLLACNSDDISSGWSPGSVVDSGIVATQKWFDDQCVHLLGFHSRS